MCASSASPHRMPIPETRIHPLDGVEPVSRLPIFTTSFVGREQETAQLSAILIQRDIRLVTMTGPGGVGKTRLALHVAKAVGENPETTIHLLSLATLDDAAFVAPAIGQRYELGGYESDRLAARIANAIGSQSTLIVLDNLERLVESGPILKSILDLAPSLTFLVTSRIPLRLSVESIFPVPPLPLPSTEDSDELVDQSPAVRLFRQRASFLADPGDLNAVARERQCIAEVCRHLDGLPLAVELAAARTNTLTPCELCERLDHRLAWLEDGPRDAPARLQTMRNAIAWSYDALSPFEKHCFERLSVFSGGFTNDAAVAVATGDDAAATFARGAFAEASIVSMSDAVLRAVAGLHLKHLLTRSATGGVRARFTMLETLREFGWELLVKHGDADRVKRLHAEWFASRLAAPTPEEWTQPFGSREIELQNEEDNLRVALHWAIEHQSFDIASQIIWILAPFWKQNGHISEARSAIDRVLHLPQEVDPYVYAGLTRYAAELAWFQSDGHLALTHAGSALEHYERLAFKPGIGSCYHEIGSAYKCLDNAISAEYFAKAIAVFRELKNEPAMVWALLNLGRAWIGLNDLEKAKGAIEEGFARASHWEHDAENLSTIKKSLSAWGWFGRGWITYLDGDPAASRSSIDRALAIFVGIGDRYGEQSSHRFLGRIARVAGDLDTASRHLMEAYRITRTLGTLHAETYCLGEIAVVANMKGAPAISAMLLGGEASIRERIDKMLLLPDERDVLDFAAQSARENLGEIKFSQAFQEGRELSPTLIFENAVTLLELASAASRSDLTSRELAVLQLVADGLTNREIASSLYISRRTVDGHVMAILAKFDTRSRRDAVRIAREKGMLGSH